MANWESKYEQSKSVIDSSIKELQTGIEKEEAKLKKTFKELPASEGKSGREIGTEFQRLLTDIAKIKSKKAVVKTQRAFINELELKRKNFLSDLSEYRVDRS